MYINLLWFVAGMFTGVVGLSIIGYIAYEKEERRKNKKSISLNADEIYNLIELSRKNQFQDIPTNKEIVQQMFNSEEIRFGD